MILRRFSAFAFGSALFAASVGASAQTEPIPTFPVAPFEAREVGVAEADPGGEDLGGELVVDLASSAAPSDLESVVRDAGGSIRWNSELSEGGERLSLVRAPEGKIAALLARLRGDSRVEAVEPSVIFRASFVPNDPLYSEKQWHIARVGAERAWEFGSGRGVTVAVVDTGVACFDKGPFMRGTDLDRTRCGGGYNFVHDSTDAYDDQGHGTHVAGTIAQSTNNGKGVAGLAFDANLMPVKVLNKNGWGTLGDVAEGIRYAADHGARIINLSLGGARPASALEKAVRHAQDKGVLIVAAAGNSGRSVGYPAAYPGVIAVSATDSNDNIAWFSSRGPQVVIAAPGVSVTQQTVCDGGKNKCELFGTFNGTSMASPHVAGAAALVAGMGVSYSDAIKAALVKSATAKDDAKLFGAGVLEAGKAVSHVYWSHLFERALGLVLFFSLVAMRIKRKGGWVSASPATLVGALFGGVGLAFFLPLLGGAVRFGELRHIAEYAMRPFGEWDLLFFGEGMHRWLPFASALPVVGAFGLFFGIRSARPLLGGLAIGNAALLAQIALMADVAFPLGSLVLRAFAVVNVFVLLWLARLALDKRPI